MTALLPISSRDKAALDLATSDGRLYVPTADAVSELSPARAVSISLARHLARISGRVENPMSSQGESVAFRRIDYEWPKAWDVALYPRAVVVPMSSRSDDALINRPFVVTTPAGATEIIGDGFAMWRKGEDVGEIAISIFAPFASHAEALARAVRSALQGDLDLRDGAVLPLPEAYLAPPFRELLDVASLPVCSVRCKGGAGETDRAAEQEGNVWRADVLVAWQAPTFEARPALPAFNPVVNVVVT